MILNLKNTFYLIEILKTLFEENMASNVKLQNLYENEANIHNQVPRKGWKNINKIGKAFHINL